MQGAAQFIFSPPLGKHLNIIEEYEDLSLIGRSEFCSQRQTEAAKKKLSMPPCCRLTFIGHGGQYDAKTNTHPLTGYCERHSLGRDFGFLYVNQPTSSLSLCENHVRANIINIAGIRLIIGTGCIP